jgi:flavin-dependent dehydrogenase
MEYYDVIIVGAGIAGCGLAYNLKRIGYSGKVLVIDKKELGANKGHNVRSIFSQTIKEYNLPYFQKYKGIKMCVYDQEIFTIKEKVYSTHYDTICKNLFKRSLAKFKKEYALEIKNKTLYTNTNKYDFKYLVDCSGPYGFLRRNLKMHKPLRYWIGILKKIELKKEDNIDQDYIYYSHGDNGYAEEINPHGKFITYGDWQHTDKANFNLIKPPKRKMLKKLVNNPKVIEESEGVMVNSPMLPIIYRNYAFLGDSLGTSPTSSGAGVGPTLDSSLILAKAIVIKNLKYYEREWKKNYLEPYIKFLVNKINLNTKNKIIKKIKNYPSYEEIFKVLLKSGGEEYSKMLQDPTYILQVPQELYKIFPAHQKLFQLYYYIKLKFKYFLIDLKYKLIQ